MEFNVEQFIEEENVKSLLPRFKVLTIKTFVMGDFLLNRVCNDMCLIGGMTNSFANAKKLLRASSTQREFVSRHLHNVISNIIEEGEFVVLNDYSSKKWLDIRIILATDNKIEPEKVVFYREQVLKSLTTMAIAIHENAFRDMFVRDLDKLVDGLYKRIKFGVN